MQLKYNFLLSILYVFHCQGMNFQPPSDPNKIAIRVPVPNYPIPVMHTRSESYYNSSPISIHMSFNSTPSYAQHASTIDGYTYQQTQSIAQQYQLHVEVIAREDKKRIERTIEDTRNAAYEKIVLHYFTLKAELNRIQESFRVALVLNVSSDIKAAILNGCDPREFELPTSKSIAEQQRFANNMMELAGKQSMIKIVQNCMEHCEHAIQRAFNTELKPLIDKTSTNELTTQLSVLKQEIIKLEHKIRQTSENQQYQIDLYIKQAKCKYIESILQERMQQQITDKQIADFKQLHDDLVRMQFDDKQILNAIAQTIDSKCVQYTTNNGLNHSEEKFLRELGIQSEIFKSLTGNHFQKCLFDKTNNILYETALCHAQHSDKPHVQTYIRVTGDMCHVTIQKIKQGTPQEALAAYKIAKAVQTTTKFIIEISNKLVHHPIDSATGLVKGIAHGSIEVVKGSAELFLHPTQIVTDLKQAFSLLINIANSDPQTISALTKAFDEFNKLPAEQQAEHIGALFATLLSPCPIKTVSNIAPVNKALQAIVKTIKLEIEGAKALYKIEKTVLVNVHGVAVHEKFAHHIKDLVQANVLKTQDDIARYVEHLNTPFFASCKEAIIEAVKDIKPCNWTFLTDKNIDAITTIISCNEPVTKEIQLIEKANRELKLTIDEFLAPKLQTPEMKKVISEYLNQYKQKLNAQKCPVHGVITKGKTHLHVPEELAHIITNEKDWEKLAKAFDGIIKTPVINGKQASIWTDYQHVLGPCITLNAKENKISLAGFHHDFGGKIRESGIIKYTDIKDKGHGFYEAYWAYGNAKPKYSTFFPDHWTPAQVMHKIEEALKNPVNPQKPLKFTDKSWVYMGKTNDGIKIQIYLEFDRLNNFNLTGKIISAFPDFK